MILTSRCPNCGCHSHHTQDRSTSDITWCPHCGAGCWTSPAEPLPVNHHLATWLEAQATRQPAPAAASA